MIFGAFFISLYIKGNPKYFDDYSETDSLIQTLYTKNGLGLILKDDFENSLYKDPSVAVYTFTSTVDEDDEPVIIEPFLKEYLLITSANVFSSSETKKIDKVFLTNIFAADSFYHRGYKVYRYIPESLNKNKEKLDEFFNYFEIENPIFDAETKADEKLNGLGSSFVNFTLYCIILVGLLLVIFNVVKNDILRTTSYGKIIKASLIGLGMLYLFNILGNMISTVTSALLKEKVLETTNQLTIIETLNSGDALMMIASVVLLGPIVEELVFRKTFFSLFKNKISAIIISSLVFGFIHLTGEPSLKSALISLPAYFIPGLVFGYIYYKNDENILVPTITHILYNLISVILISFL